MSRYSLIGVLVASSIGFASVAIAQNSGTDAEQEACTPDVFRLCEAYIPNEAPIVACLKSNRTQLSPACYKVFYADAGATTGPRKRRRSRVD